MRIANTAELKNRTNELVAIARRGEPVVITVRGKPAAALTPLSEEDLEDFVLEHSPKVRRLIEAAEADIRRGRTKGLRVLLGELDAG
jgi:prevent-host-death family protein